MRLMRWGAKGEERPGMVLDDGTYRDLSGVIPDLAGDALSPATLNRLRGLDPTALPVVPEANRLGPPVAGVGKVICIGLNYADHAKEVGKPLPEEPLIFMKATSAISGAFDPIPLPRGSEKLDWEVELGVVIGTRARYVDAATALDHVAGYCVVNDVSERDFQMNRGGQWVKGKSHDGFCPLGPWLVTADAVADPQDLRLWCAINGERLQDGTTRTMVFPVDQVIAHLSEFMTLEPGDVIATGTPPGVGMARNRYLGAGDEVRTGVEGLGEQFAVVMSDPET